MAEVLFFILGAVFSLMLLMALLVVLSGQSPAAAQSVLPDPAPERATAQARPRAAARAPGARMTEPLCLPDPTRVSRAEREAYRIAHALDLAERALGQIARNGEAAAAKIAAQTLRRLADASEPKADRLRFALARLDLLALRPEPRARAQAQAALNALA